MVKCNRCSEQYDACEYSLIIMCIPVPVKKAIEKHCVPLEHYLGFHSLFIYLTSGHPIYKRFNKKLWEYENKNA